MDEKKARDFNAYDKIKQYKNYAIIGLVSLVCLFILPFLSSEVGIAFIFPNTVAGWLVFVFNKLLIAVVNILILYCFVSQGKFNVRNEPTYIKARELLSQQCPEHIGIPLSPKQHYARVFGAKGTTLFITTAAASVSLTQAVLAFDLATFISYFITIMMGVIFGIIQMGSEEIWWTEDYYAYAVYTAKQNKISSIQKEEKTKGDTNDTIYQSSI